MQNQRPNDPRQPRRPQQQPPERREPPQRTPPQRRRSKGEKGESGRWIRAILMVIATITVCIIIALNILQIAYDFTGLEQADKQIEVDIPEGSSNADVARILEESGIIGNAWVFRIYADLKTKDRPLQAGTYRLNSSDGYDEIIRDLRVGNNIKIEVTVMIPEGSTLREIAQILEEKEVCSADAFIDYLQTAEYDYEFFNGIPDSSQRYFKLEGYLFPDTYNFYVGESVSEVARKFLNNFNSKIDDSLQTRMQDMNLSIDETIILASIIQREAANVDDMHLVSSVFHNRMYMSEVYPRLQSDVTIFYVNNNIKPYLQQTNQAMYDAYNTYEREGLPVGAICNPGMNAIRAALYPVESDYYFFVTDSEGQFYWAETANEHYRNVQTAVAVGGEAHGVDTQ